MVRVHIEIDQPAEERVDGESESTFDVAPFGRWIDIVGDDLSGGVHQV